MATDVNRMIVLVENKGVKETSKEIDKLTTNTQKSTKAQKESTKTQKEGTEQQAKFTTATGQFRNELPNVASGLYLVQQAWSAVSSVMEDVTVKYEEQFAAEIQLNAIMRTTGNAVGYTTDQIRAMSDAWSSLTGINDAVLDKAYAIGATFVDISQEAFPGLIEQALNMSTVFRQDLQQSTVQLGVALNNLQVSRLTRVGISFSDAQKEMIASLRDSGKVVEAQTLILEELEYELGGLAEAMGESTLGTIDKFGTAIVNMQEETGEALTTFKAELIDFFDLVPRINKVTQALTNLNSYDKIEGLIDSKVLQEDAVLSTLSLEELTNAYTHFLQLEQFETNRAEAAWFKKDKEAAAELADSYTHLAVEIYNAIQGKKALTKAQQDAIDEAKKAKELEQQTKAQEQLNIKLQDFYKLREKAALAGIDNKYDKERKQLALDWKEIAIQADSYGLTLEQLNNITGNYYDVMKDLIDLQEKQNDIKLFGTEEQKALQDYSEYYTQVMDAFGRGSITIERARELIGNWGTEAEETQEKLQELGTVESFDSLFDNFISGTMDAIDWTKSFENTIKNLKVNMLSIGATGITDTLHDLGNAWREGKDAGDAFARSMLKMVDSALEAIGPQLMLAGIQTMIASPLKGYDPVGWGLLLAGGGATLVGGFIDSSGSGGGSTSSTSFGSAQTIETFDPTNSLPLTSPSDTRGASLSVSNNIINNAGVTVETNESTAPDGSVILETVLSAVSSKYKVNERTVPVA